MASPTTIAIVAAGAMGSGIARRLHAAGCTILTNLEGRSEATRQRAKDAGMEDATLADIAVRARWLLSILPPGAANSFARRFIEALPERTKGESARVEIVYVDCNPINPESVKDIASLFLQTSGAIPFVDACIFGGPPREDGHTPNIYASVALQNEAILDEFAALSKLGLRILPLKGAGGGIGSASALKMSVSGITTASTALFTTMILAAHASSPATAEALMHELHSSQPDYLRRIIAVVPPMLSKAYRFVYEMEEISSFVEEEDIYNGLANHFRRIQEDVERETDDVDVLKEFVEKAKQAIDGFAG